MPERPDNGSSQPRGALSSALRDALQFDRRAISIQAGLLAAIPVAAVLAIGTIAWSAVAGVTMGAGAMLVGVAWRVGGRPSTDRGARDRCLADVDLDVRGVRDGIGAVASLRRAVRVVARGRAARGARQPRWGRRDPVDHRVRRVRAVQPARRARARARLARAHRRLRSGPVPERRALAAATSGGSATRPPRPTGRCRAWPAPPRRARRFRPPPRSTRRRKRCRHPCCSGTRPC